MRFSIFFRKQKLPRGNLSQCPVWGNINGKFIPYTSSVCQEFLSKQRDSIDNLNIDDFIDEREEECEN